MNKFRSFLALMLVLCMALCLCACADEPAETSSTTEATESTTESTSDGKVDYKVTVLYPDGTPVVGCYVQICTDAMCYNPSQTDENGVATFHMTQQDGYKTKLLQAVEGYVYDEEAYLYFESGATEITITLVAEE